MSHRPRTLILGMVGAVRLLADDIAYERRAPSGVADELGD